jgi:hypothetical protein
MRVFAKRILREFWEKHNDTEQQLKTWYKVAELYLTSVVISTDSLLKLTTKDNGLLLGLLELILNMIKLMQKKFRNYESKSY